MAMKSMSDLSFSSTQRTASKTREPADIAATSDECFALAVASLMQKGAENQTKTEQLGKFIDGERNGQAANAALGAEPLPKKTPKATG